ncbi:regulatory protein RecX [Paraglaciecola sp.]|uniref:regulatory protein RecX n=1 Tax=Paraglaciecola sp. TaxID=1920173 RepID=UPI0030F42B24
MTVEDEQLVIKHTITRLLAMREQSLHELALKLRQRNFNGELVQEWLNKFSCADLQSELRFAEMLARSRINKGLGELRLKNEFNQHNISQDIVKRVLQDLSPDWFELALQALNKKNARQGINSAKEQQKYYRFLQQRGFSAEQIHYAIQSLKD